MADKNNATCSICGSGYYACLSCKDAMKLHPYKIYCCSASHYQVFQVVRGLSTGVYTKDEAREKFKNIDLSDVESFRPHIRDIVKDALKEEKTEKNVESTTEETIETKLKDDMVVEDKIKTTYSRKKNYRVETE